MRTRLPTKVRVLTYTNLSESLSKSNQGIDLDKDTMATVYEKFGLEPGTQDFIGHAMALYLDDE